MSISRAASRRDFAFARRTNMRVNARGALVLTSKNHAPNPRFTDVLEDGTPEGYEPFDVRRGPRGKNVYIGPRGERATRQNDLPVRTSQPTFLQDDALIFGDDLPGAAALRGVPVPGRPLGTGIPDNTRGYPAGVAETALIYMTGPVGRPRQRRFTTVGPPSAQFTLAEGQVLEQELPSSVPESVSGLGIAIRYRSSSSLPANLLNRWHVQDVFSVARFVPQSRRLKQFIVGNPAPLTNQTYIGQVARYGVVGVKKGLAYWALEPLFLRISWQFMLANGGISATQPVREFTYGGAVSPRTAFYLTPPRVPVTARRWRPVFQMIDGNFYSVDYGAQGSSEGWLNFSTPAYVHTSNPENWPPGSRLVSASLTTEDTTGVEPPEESLDAPGIFGESRIPPGPYTVYVTDDYGEDGESRPSVGQVVNVASGQVLRVDLSDDPYDDGNLLPNAIGEERRPNGTPLYWSSQNTQKTYEADGELGVNESSATATTVYWQSDAFKVDAALPHTERFIARFASRSSGSLGVRLQFLDGSGVHIQTLIIGSRTTNGPVEFTVGPASGANPNAMFTPDAVFPAGTTQMRWQVVGVPENGTLSLNGTVGARGHFKGYAAPAIRPGNSNASGAKDDETLGADSAVEDVALPYQSGSYAVMLEDFPAGFGCAEYYGTFGTPVAEKEFLRGLAVALERSETWTVSCEFEGEGISSGSRVYGGLIRDAAGEIVGETPGIALAPNASGRVSGRLSATWITPNIAGCIWESKGAKLGAGRLRVRRVQVERGANATAFDDSHAASGTVRQFLDLHTPGVEIGEDFGMLTATKRVVSFGAVGDVPDGTAVSARIRMKKRVDDAWGAWFSRPEDLTLPEMKKLCEVEVVASTTNPQFSPEIEEIAVVAEREVATLLKEDGSEYYGGLHVFHMPNKSPVSNEESRVDMFGRRGFRELYPAESELRGLVIHGYDRRGTEEAMADTARGNRIFRVCYRGRYWIVRILDMHFKLNAPENDEGKSFHVAEVDAEVIRIIDMGA